MKLNNLLAAGLMGVTMALSTPATVVAQTKKIVTVASNQTSESIVVPLNRAIVLESDQSFAELSVANPGIADIATLSDRTIYVLGKTPGRTTLTLLGADGRLITNVNVIVNPDLAEFKELVNEIMPGEKIEIRAANDGIVVSGVASGTQTLARIVELAERYAPGKVTNVATVGGSHQVNLKVRFAEMSRTISKGLNGSVSGTDGVSTFGTGTLVSAANVARSLGDPIALAEGVLGGISGRGTVGGVGFNVLIEALENKGLVRTLAEPNLVAISGNEAYFLAGGEFPIQTIEDGSVKIEYKPFGVELKFKPTVLDNDNINLVLQSVVSEIDEGAGEVFNNVNLPVFSRREARTTVEMKDGESIAIAGMLSDNFTDNAAQIPWIGDVPVLGSLFRSSSYQRDQSELVIIVTASLITPVDGNSLALPTDRVRLPSEGELFFLGKTTGSRKSGSNKNGTVESQDFGSSFGYVME